MDVIESKAKNRNFLIFISILIPIVLILGWILYFTESDKNSSIKIVSTSVLLIILLIWMWIRYYVQLKVDSNKSVNGKLKKATEIGNKIEGLSLTYQGVTSLIGSILLILGGIFVLIIKFKELWWVGAILIIFGLALIYVFLSAIAFGKPKLKGRYY